jgi:uncharacterized membrane protein
LAEDEEGREGSEPTEAPEEPEEPEAEKKWYSGIKGGSEGDSRAMGWFKFLFPIAFTMAIVFIVYIFLSYDRWWKWAGLAFAYLVPPAGKESVIPIGVAAGYHWLAMAGTIILMDFVCALFIAWNFPLAKRIPGLGYYIGLIERTGAKKMEGNKALQAGAWIGIVLFVMVPFQGSGGVTSSIIGRTVGMKTTHLVSGVALGAAISGLVIGYIAWQGISLLKYNLVGGVITILLVAVAALAVYILIRWYRMRKWRSEA